MRGNLWDDPRVARICDLTDNTEAAVVGALYWLWATADQHTENGVMPGLTLRQIDRKTGLQGFGAALVSIGWLTADDEGCSIVHFDEHNGASAKKRCQTAKRVAAFKVGNADSVTEPLAVRDLEKELEKREEKHTHTALRGDWVLPKAWGQWAIEHSPHWTPDVVRVVADRFAAHAHSKARTSADWLAMWQLWCGDPLTQSAHGPPKTPPKSKCEPGITVPSNDEKATQALLAERLRHAAQTESVTPEQREATAQRLRETRQKLRAA